MSSSPSQNLFWKVLHSWARAASLWLWLDHHRSVTPCELVPWTSWTQLQSKMVFLKSDSKYSTLEWTKNVTDSCFYLAIHSNCIWWGDTVEYSSDAEHETDVLQGDSRYHNLSAYRLLHRSSKNKTFQYHLHETTEQIMSDSMTRLAWI